MADNFRIRARSLLITNRRDTFPSSTYSSRHFQTNFAGITVENAQHNVPINSKLHSASPLGNPSSCPVVRNFNFAWLGWGMWTESIKSFQRNTNVISLKMEFFKVQSSLTRAQGSEGPQGQGFKAWSMYRKLWTVIDFSFYKKWMGHLNLILTTWERKFEQANLPKFKCQRYCPVGGERCWSFEWINAGPFDTLLYRVLFDWVP